MAEFNSSSDVSRGYILITVSTVTATVASILLCLRLFVRAKILRSSLGWDDYFIVLAMISALTVVGLGATATHFGVGRHTYYLSFEDSIQANKWNTIAQVPLTLSTTFARASICLFLLRLFTINIAWRRILYLVNGLNIISGLVASTTILSACRPVGKIWNPEAPGTCRAPNINNGLSLFQGAVSVFCDWVLAFLPIFFLWNVQLSFRVKVGICSLTGLGLFTGTFSLARTILLAKFPVEDFTYNIIYLDICAVMEMMTAIILACIPTIRPLFRAQSIKYFQSHFNRYRANPHPNKNGYIVHENERQHFHHRHSLKTQSTNLSFLSDIETQHIPILESQTDTLELRAMPPDAITALPPVHLSPTLHWEIERF